MRVARQETAIRRAIRDLADAPAGPDGPERDRLHEALDRDVLAMIERHNRRATMRVTRREKAIHRVILDLADVTNAAEPDTPGRDRWLASLDASVLAMIERHNRRATMRVPLRERVIHRVICDLREAVNAAERGSLERDRLQKSLDAAVLAMAERDNRRNQRTVAEAEQRIDDSEGAVLTVGLVVVVIAIVVAVAFL